MDAMPRLVLEKTVIKGYFYDNGAKTEKDESPGCTEGRGLKEENFLSENLALKTLVCPRESIKLRKKSINQDD